VVVNLLCGFLEIQPSRLVMLKREDLITEPVPPTPDGRPVTPPAVRVADTSLALPTWMLPHLRTYVCRRDHHAPVRAAPYDALLVDDGRLVTANDADRLLARSGRPDKYGYVHGSDLPATGGRPYVQHHGSHLITSWINERHLSIHDLSPFAPLT
jgi:hypothetical protein